MTSLLLNLIMVCNISLPHAENWGSLQDKRRINHKMHDQSSTLFPLGFFFFKENYSPESDAGNYFFLHGIVESR